MNKITISPSQSQLHGRWVSTDPVMVSDRRLKQNIRSLLDGRSVDGEEPGRQTLSNRSPAWLLRQLRPVSYRFRRDSAGKKVERDSAEPRRFGFIADELQQIVPEVVRTVRYENEQAIKAV